MENKGCYDGNISMDAKNGIIEMEGLLDLMIQRRNSWKDTQEELRRKQISSAATSCAKCGALSPSNEKQIIDKVKNAVRVIKWIKHRRKKREIQEQQPNLYNDGSCSVVTNLRSITKTTSAPNKKRRGKLRPEVILIKPDGKRYSEEVFGEIYNNVKLDNIRVD